MPHIKLRQKPNFFIVGAPKAGTTALSEYLGDHQSIFVSNPKEPFFFCPEFSGLPGPKTLEAYLDLFTPVDERVQTVGEASAMYLYSKDAAARIKAFCKHSKIVIMLRNPVDIAYAFHSQLLHASSETEQDFERAWELQESRITGQNLPPHVREPLFLQYRNIALLGEQVERYQRMFSREQIHYIVFDQFIRNTLDTYQGTLDFLNVEYDGRTDFRPANANKTNRSQKLAMFLNRPPPWASEMARQVKRVLGLRNQGFLTPLRHLNVTVESRKPLSRELRKTIAKSFRADIELLSVLTDTDLTAWTT
jgi:hypothetical protein